MKRTLLIVLFTICLIFNAYAKESIGVVDFSKILASYEKSQNVQDMLKMELEKRQSELSEEGKKLQEKKDEFEKDKKSGKISEDEYKKKINDLQIELIGYQKKASKYDKELSEMESKYFKEISDDIDKAIENISKKYKLDYVLEKYVTIQNQYVNARIRTVHYGGKDITDEVIEDLNK